MLDSEHPYPNTIASMEKVLSPSAMFKFNIAFDKSIKRNEVGNSVIEDNPKTLPSEISEIIYKFDSKLNRWRLNTASSEKKKYIFKEEIWKEIK